MSRLSLVQLIEYKNNSIMKRELDFEFSLCVYNFTMILEIQNKKTLSGIKK